MLRVVVWGKEDRMSAAGEPSTRDALWQMTNAYQVSPAIHVAVTLGIADLSRLRFTPGLARSVDLQGDNNLQLIYEANPP
jgi:hypothetical protein